MRIRYSPARYSHIKELEAININAMPENYKHSFWALIISQHLSIVAKCNDVIIGYILMGKIDKEHNAVTIISLAVDSKFRGKGIGRTLLNSGIEKGRKIKKNGINLTVRISNSIAIKLYKANGFIEIETIADYYKNPDEPGLCMIRNLG